MKEALKNKKILFTFLCGFLLLLTGISYAYFNFIREGTKKSILVLGEIYMHFDETDELKIENAIPRSTYDPDNYFEFTIKGKNTNTEKDIWYDILLTDGNNHATRTERLDSEYLKFTLIEVTDGTEKVIADAVTYSEISDGRIWVDKVNKNTTTEITRKYRLYVWISDKVRIGNTESAIYSQEIWNKQVYASIKVSVTGDFNEKSVEINSSSKTVVQDPSGANPPVLPSNMIAIKYDGTKWVKADKFNTNLDWFNYENKIWANAVTLKENGTLTRDAYLKAKAGTEIKEEDILTYMIWIPRYTYTILNGNNENIAEQEIEIKFESGKTTTGTVACTVATDGKETCTDKTNGDIINGKSTYTHPAFTFGTDELTGIWVGKFETTGTIGTTCTNTTCTTGSLTIKPNVISLRSKTVSNMYYATRSMNRSENEYGFLDTKVDTHMMKNIEWGAVAYLTLSKYGRCTSGVCTEVSINNSSEFYTGRSSGSPNTTTNPTPLGTYKYETIEGQTASTTGNIYGIYDMSGGAEEYVMGNMLTSSGTFSPAKSGFNNTTILYPESKYYDKYAYGTSNITHNRGHLGDATRENMKRHDTFGGWYSDSSTFVYDSYSIVWFIRGGKNNESNACGIFNFNGKDGPLYSVNSWRVSITNK